MKPILVPTELLNSDTLFKAYIKAMSPMTTRKQIHKITSDLNSNLITVREANQRLEAIVNELMPEQEIDLKEYHTPGLDKKKEEE